MAKLDYYEFKNNKKHTVAFLMSDGDNLQWFYNTFFSENWFGHKQRGISPISWTLSSSIVEILPEIYQYLFDSSSTNDYFVSAPSGEGYNFPSEYKDYNEYVIRMKRFLIKSNLSIVNILDKDNPNPMRLNQVFNELTRNEISEGNLHNLSKNEDQVNPIKGIIYYPFGDYSGWNGKIIFKNGIPIIGGRNKLWEGFDDPKSLSTKLNNSSTDSTIEDGYSIIPVHVWSMHYEKVIETISMLNPEVIDVVTVGELFKRVINNVKNINNEFEFPLN